MRKILLGTTAVVGLALAAPAAFAQSAAPAVAGAATSALNVRLGGFFEMTYGVVSDEADKSGVNRRGAGLQSRNTTDFRTEAEIALYVDGTAANGLQYGAFFEFQMDNALSATTGSNTGVDFDEIYGYAKGAWGELRFGNEDSAASLLQVTRPVVWGMGVSDQWDEFLVSDPHIIAGLGDGGDATKIIYLSPQFNGFDFGLSYAANRFEGERQDSSTASVNQRDNTGLTNEITAALRYRGTVGGVGIQAGLAAMFADSAKQSTGGVAIATRDQNVTAYSAGLVLAGLLPGLSIGGDYTWGKYRGTPGGSSVAAGVDGSTQLTLGATYTAGNLTLGVNYGSAVQSNGGTVDDRTQTFYGVGMAYVVAPGMSLYANYNVITDENNPTAQPTSSGATRTSYGNDYVRDITVAIAGVRVAF